MAEAAVRERWARASSLMALLANCNRDPKRSRAFKPADFDPHSARQVHDLADKEQLAQFRAGMTGIGNAKKTTLQEPRRQAPD